MTQVTGHRKVWCSSDLNTWWFWIDWPGMISANFWNRAFDYIWLCRDEEAALKFCGSVKMGIARTELQVMQETRIQKKPHSKSDHDEWSAYGLSHRFEHSVSCKTALSDSTASSYTLYFFDLLLKPHAIPSHNANQDLMHALPRASHKLHNHTKNEEPFHNMEEGDFGHRYVSTPAILYMLLLNIPDLELVYANAWFLILNGNLTYYIKSNLKWLFW